MRVERFANPYALPSSTGSSSILAQAQQWLHDCLAGHDHCNKGRDDQLMPTRLIDVNASKVVYTSQINVKGAVKYACLSHCRGRQKPACMTTRDTLPDLLKGIASHLAPQNFADAFEVTRLLALRYIWIDSVCIIQDSQENWHIESAAKADIYSNAMITIAATGAKSFDSGLVMCPLQSHQMRPYPSSLEADPQLSFRRSLPHYTTFDSHPTDAHWPYEPLGAANAQEGGGFLERNDSSLLGRAWVLQERLLSGRFLLLTPQELMFECLSRKMCQCSVLTEWWKYEDGWGCYKPVSSTLFYGHNPHFSENRAAFSRDEGRCVTNQ
jgi:hypothetical protein